MSDRPFFEDEESVVALPFKDEMSFYKVPDRKLTCPWAVG